MQKLTLISVMCVGACTNPTNEPQYVTCPEAVEL